MNIAIKTQLIFLYTLLSIYPSCANFINNSGKQWEKISKKNDEIHVYERWVEIENGKSVREKKGEFTLECTVEQAVKVIESTEKTQEWMSGVKDAYKLDEVAKEGYYTYTFYKIPWPFSDRDLISHITKKTERSGKRVIINISSKSNLIPEIENVTRMQEYHAEWLIEEVSSGTVKITFKAISHEAPSFPRWMMDPVLKKIFINNLSNLKQLILNQE